MKTHQSIDQRSLAMAREIVAKIDMDPTQRCHQKAIDICRRWEGRSPNQYNREWLTILAKPWEKVRAILLDESEEGQRLRQNSPFCGILSPKERWGIYKRFHDHEKTRSRTYHKSRRRDINFVKILINHNLISAGEIELTAKKLDENYKKPVLSQLKISQS